MTNWCVLFTAYHTSQTTLLGLALCIDLQPFHLKTTWVTSRNKSRGKSTSMCRLGIVQQRNALLDLAAPKVHTWTTLSPTGEKKRLGKCMLFGNACFISAKPPDNCILVNNLPCLVHSVNQHVVFYKKFFHIRDVYSHAFPSSKFNIVSFNKLSPKLHSILLSGIQCKCVCLPYSSDFVIPVLHTIQST